MISRSAGGRPDSDDRSERHFLALGHQQCLDLMEAHHLGRRLAGRRSPAGPAGHLRHAPGRRLLPQSPDSILAELAQPTSVALEVDELDQQNRSGWRSR